MGSATMTETRAQAAGISAAKYARKAARFIAATRTRLQALAYEWNEIDSNVSEWAANDLARALEDFEKELNEAVARLKRPIDEDEG